MTRYCPQCGAGKNLDGSFTVSYGGLRSIEYLTRPDCEWCKMEHEERMKELGRKLGKQKNDYVLKALEKICN